MYCYFKDYTNNQTKAKRMKRINKNHIQSPVNPPCLQTKCRIALHFIIGFISRFRSRAVIRA